MTGTLMTSACSSPNPSVRVIGAYDSLAQRAAEFGTFWAVPASALSRRAAEFGTFWAVPAAALAPGSIRTPMPGPTTGKSPIDSGSLQNAKSPLDPHPGHEWRTPKKYSNDFLRLRFRLAVKYSNCPASGCGQHDPVPALHP